MNVTNWRKVSEAMANAETKPKNILQSKTTWTVGGSTAGAGAVIWLGSLFGVAVPPLLAPVIAGVIAMGISRGVAWMRGKIK